MSNNKQLGAKGEAIACNYLKANGYSIREKNYRFRHKEIDIIASLNNCLVFVEVKLRSSVNFGYPEDFVDDKKSEFVMEAAEQYLLDIDWQGKIRFDIIAIVFRGTSHQLQHIQDAFF